MRRDLGTAAIAVVVITLLCGVAYPLVVTGVAQVAFPGRANGSRVDSNGRVTGSRLIAQDFKRSPRYFQSRPSTQTKYAPDATAFTNLGPNSKTARDTFAANLRAYLALERPYYPAIDSSRVPVDAVTSSASGVDPHISEANAAIQAHRVASVRHLAPVTVSRLIRDHTDGRFLGALGEPGVNVLELNLALDGMRP